MRPPKSTLLCTQEATKKHDLDHHFLHEGGHQKAQFLCVNKATEKDDFLHKGGHQKARSRPPFFARRKPPKSTIFCTKEATTKHALHHHFLHEGGHQKKHDFLRAGGHHKARSRPAFLARRKPPQSTIVGTQAATKKHDFLHERKRLKTKSARNSRTSVS